MTKSANSPDTATPREPASEEADPSPADRGGVQVIARAASILRALKEHPDGLTLGELARLLSLPRSTIQRIVDALDRESLVISATPSRGVRLGPGLLPLAAAARFEIAEYARPALQELSRLTSETVDLSILDGQKLVFVEQVTGIQRLKAESGVGVSFALHSTAPGKAMLAALSKEVFENLRPRLKLTRHTAKTITNWSVLEDALAKVRSTGLAYDIEENSVGICAVAMAIPLPAGELAAVSIPVPLQRFAENQGRLEKQLVAACRKLQQGLV